MRLCVRVCECMRLCEYVSAMECDQCAAYSADDRRAASVDVGSSGRNRVKEEATEASQDTQKAEQPLLTTLTGVLFVNKAGTASTSALDTCRISLFLARSVMLPYSRQNELLITYSVSFHLFYVTYPVDWAFRTNHLPHTHTHTTTNTSIQPSIRLHIIYTKPAESTT